jgi:hypothetical protein
LLDEEHVLAEVNDYLDSAHKPQLPQLSTLYDQVDATLLTTLPEIDHYPQRKSGDYYGTWLKGDGPPPEWPQAEGKRVFAYLRNFDSLPVLLNLLAKSKLPTLAVIPDCPKPLLDIRCDNVRIQKEPVSLQRAAEECDLAVHYGGHSTTLQLLLAGKPLFLLPLLLEQRITAQRVADLGAGYCVNPLDTESLPRRWNQFLGSSESAAGAQAFQKRYSDFSPTSQLERATGRLLQLLR